MYIEIVDYKRLYINMNNFKEYLNQKHDNEYHEALSAVLKTIYLVAVHALAIAHIVLIIRISLL